MTIRTIPAKDIEPGMRVRVPHEIFASEDFNPFVTADDVRIIDGRTVSVRSGEHGWATFGWSDKGGPLRVTTMVEVKDDEAIADEAEEPAGGESIPALTGQHIRDLYDSGVTDATLVYSVGLNDHRRNDGYAIVGYGTAKERGYHVIQDRAELHEAYHTVGMSDADAEREAAALTQMHNQGLDAERQRLAAGPGVWQDEDED